MDNRFLCRGKRIDNGEWVEGNYVVQHGIPKIYCEVQDVSWDTYPVDPATIGQCTGLTDKNGCLIFEGDILKSTLGWIFVVEWEEDGRFLGFTFENERRIIYVNREPKTEIIGNIHDNPEEANNG